MGILPKEYDFVHEFGKSLVPIDKKPVTYALRFVVGIIFHPVIFVFVWGRDGWLGIDPFNSAVLSAVLLLALESILFAVVLWTRILGIPPRELVGRLIVLQVAIHLVLGVLMGLSYELLA